jgi:prolyl oligopeptidase
MRNFAALMVVAASPAAMADDLARFAYPRAESYFVDYYFGTPVADPFRWLEDPDSEQTRRWVEAQNVVTRGYLEGVPQREAIQSRITNLFNYEKFGTPFKEGGKYFWSYNSGLQNQSVYMVAESLDAQPRVLLDPNTLKADGTMALAGLAISEDGRYMAYGIAEAGSDWNTWKVRDIATGQDTDDVINWVKFSGASFTKDGKGFFYSRFDEPKPGQNELTGSNFFQKVFYHTIGTPQSADVLVYNETDEAKKDWGFGAGVTEDGRYLVFNVSKGTDPKNRVYIKDLSQGSLGDRNLVKLLDDFDASYDYVGNDGSVFYFKTDLDAPRGRLIAIDLNNPQRSSWKELIPQGENVIQAIGLTGNNFFVNYLKDAKTVIKVHDLAGKFVREVELPGIGSAGGFGGKRTDTETFYSFTGFTTPPRIYRYDIATGASTLYKQANVGFNPDDYTTTQVFYTSKDGTKVPMFITHKKSLALDGSNPTLLYGYGGFNISITPSFSVSNLVWMEMGGVYAVANIRGGSEYGEEWHEAGTKLKKQNVFDDFIAAGEWLIANKYTSSPKLAVRGGSNGGLLVGACITQRPELFGAALPEVGVLDMLRFHKFTIGHAWSSDYGNAEESKEMFEYLRKYSPYHNAKAGTCYPPTMIMTADHDDRVVPAHSFKFAAAMQEAISTAAGCANPMLIRIETRAGHGAGKPTAKVIEEAADRWAFLVRALKMNPRMAEAQPQGLVNPVANTTVVRVTGMVCAGCEQAVCKSFKALAGVKDAKADHQTGTVTLTLADGAKSDAATLGKALEGTQFKIDQ